MSKGPATAVYDRDADGSFRLQADRIAELITEP